MKENPNQIELTTDKTEVIDLCNIFGVLTAKPQKQRKMTEDRSDNTTYHNYIVCKKLYTLFYFSYAAT